MKKVLCAVMACAALAAFGLTEWEKNIVKVDNKVKNYQNAVKKGSKNEIRKAMMEIQGDPIAVQWLNKYGTEAELKKFADETKKIHDSAKGEIRKQTVEKWNNDVDAWNKANPDKPPREHITEKDVTFFEATNKNPNAKPKAGQDWDVTVQVKGQEVPRGKVADIVNESYYNAAGGKKTFGKDSTAKQIAEQHSVNAIDSRHNEAYKDPKTLLEAKNQGKYVAGESTPNRYKYGEQFSDTMQYKSSDAVEKGAKAKTVEGRLQGEYEQFRQATKQYDNIVKPHVESLGGKIDPKLQKSMDIMKKVSNFEMSPDEARAALAKLGETSESVIQKASQQIEAAEKLRPSELNNADAAAAKAKGESNKSTKADNKKVDADSKTKGKDGKSGAKTDADAKTKTEDPYAKDRWPPDADTDTKTAKPDSKTESKTGSKSDPKSSTKADSKTEPKAEPKPDSKAEPKTDTKSNSKTETKTETKSTDTNQPKSPKTEADAPGKTKVDTDSPKVKTSDVDSPQVKPADVDSPKVKPADVDSPKVKPADVDSPKVKPADVDGPKVKPADVDAPKVKPVDVDGPKVKPVDVDAPKVKPVDVDSPKVKPVDVDAPKVKPVDVDGPKVKPVDVDAPKVKPVDVDGPKVKPVDVDGGKVKTGDVPSKIGKAVEVGGTIVNIGQYGEAAKQFTDGINEGDWDKAKEGYKDTIMNVADDITGGAASAGKNVVGAVNEGKGYFNEKNKLNEQLGGNNYEQKLTYDLVTKGGYSVEDARKIAEGYTSGDEDGKAKLEAAYSKMGENVPDKDTVTMTWKETGEAVGNYAKDVGGAVVDVGKGVVKTVVKVGEGVGNAGEIAVGLTEKGVAEEVGKTIGQNVSKENLSDGAEVIGQMSKEIGQDVKDSLMDLVGIDKNASTKEHIVNSLTRQGATKEEAEKIANEYIRDKENGNGGYSSVISKFKDELAGRSEEEKLAAQKQNIKNEISDLQDKAKAGDADALDKIDELREKYKELREREDELKEAAGKANAENEAGTEVRGGEPSLKESEGGSLPDPGADGSVADAPPGGSLGSFFDNWSQQASDKAAEGRSLADVVNQEKAQEAANKDADRTAQATVNEAGNEMNLSDQRTQADAANQQYQDSWGKAIADGVQSGVEQGMGEFTGTIGEAAGDSFYDSVSGHSGHHGGHGHGGHGHGGHGTSASTDDAPGKTAPAADTPKTGATKTETKPDTTKANDQTKPTSTKSTSASTTTKDTPKKSVCAKCGKSPAYWDYKGKTYCTKCYDKMYHSGKIK